MSIKKKTCMRIHNKPNKHTDIKISHMHKQTFCQNADGDTSCHTHVHKDPLIHTHTHTHAHTHTHTHTHMFTYTPPKAFLNSLLFLHSLFFFSLPSSLPPSLLIRLLS